MNRKSIYLVLLASVMSLSSCKKEDALSKVDPNAKEIAPASPEAVAAASPTQTPTQTTTQPQQNQVAPPPPPAPNSTSMSFNKKEHDFGTIKQGEKVSYVYTFKNTGSNDLIISSATGSCGCTVPEYPKEPIKPGKSGKMKVTFDSTGKTGMQSKTVTVRANTASGTETLTVKANIKATEAVTVTPVSPTTPATTTTTMPNN